MIELFSSFSFATGNVSLEGGQEELIASREGAEY